MDIESLRIYCLSKPDATEGMPFGDGTLVFKTGSKMFVLIALDRIPPQINLKCEPQRAVELREQYHAVLPGYHMNKTHWNSVLLEEDAEDNDILAWVDHSFDLVFRSLSKKKQAEILALEK